MPFFEVSDGTRLNYVDWGSGDPVLFLHGRGLSYEFYEYQLTALSERFRVLAYDLRGHGDSEKPNSNYSHDEFANDLWEFINRLGLDHVNLVGASTGSFIIQNYAKLFGLDHIASVTLMSTTPVFSQKPDFPYAMSLTSFDEIKRRLRENHPKALTDFFKFLLYKEPSYELLSWMFNIGMKTPLYVLLKTLEANIAMDYRKILKKIFHSKPVLIVHGRHDRLCPLEAASFLHDEVEESKFLIFEQSGHMPYLEEKEKLNSELESFFQESRSK
jgi:non-heme chloroperoxidase